MRVLTEIITRLTHNLESASIFPTMPTITFRPESNTCPRCRTKMKVLKTTAKPVATLSIGDFIAREVQYSCSCCGLVLRSEELKQLVPVRCNIGYDVLTYVGQAFFLDSVDNEQIVARYPIWRKNLSFISHCYINRFRMKQEHFCR